MPAGLEPIFLLVAMVALFYFLMIRPQQKRVKEHQASLASLQPGTRVLLTSGMFATIRHLGEKQAFVELAPGAEVTILKGNIARVVAPDEEEFEVADDFDEADDHLAEDLPAGAVEAVDEVFDPRPEAQNPTTNTN